jgi:hypothetical protein
MWRHNVDLLAYHDLDGRSGFKLALQELVHQAQDVLVDRRGVIYISEGNSGIYILTHHPSQ